MSRDEVEGRLGPPMKESTWTQLPWPIDSPNYRGSGFVAGVKTHTRFQWNGPGVTVTVCFVADADTSKGPVVSDKSIEGTWDGR
jgi:hypothetical protein